MAYTLVPTELIVDGAITSAKLDTNIAISGTLGVTGELTLATHMIMGDNDKIKIGTGGDLEIYHDGSNSYISNSTGNIYLGDTNGSVHIQAKLNEESIICAADGAVSLYHDNAVKLATTSTGIDVTGTATATNMQVSNGGKYIFGGENTRITGEIDGNGKIRMFTGGTEKVILDGSNVGIGTNSPSQALDVVGAIKVSDGILNAGAGGSVSVFNEDGTTADFRVESSGNTHMLFVDGGLNRVGIGTTSPSVLIEGQTSTANSAYLRLGTSNSGSSHTVGHDIAGLEFYSGDGSGAGSGVKGSIRYKYGSSSGATTYMSFHTAGISSDNDAERMRIDSSGNLLVGKTSTAVTTGCDMRPTGNIVASASADNPLYLNRTTSDGDIAVFAKDGTTVGSISSEGGDALIIQSGTTSGSGLLFHPSNGQIYPVRNSVKVDATLDLGRGANRFKDLYLSGKAYVSTDIRLGSEAVRLSSDGNGEFGIGYGQTATNSRFTVYNNTTAAFRVLPNGNVGIGNNNPSRTFMVNGQIEAADGTGSSRVLLRYQADGEGFSTANSAMLVGKNNGAGRSINCGGTVNASGADYAEYMKKADSCGTIAKGDVCGVDSTGKLTDVFADAISFVIKSTDPSYVGGDTWGDVDLGLTEEQTETERQKYDRIAFSGQVPVNITGSFNVGDYVYPQVNGTAIECVAKSSPTFEEYQLCVGKIWATEDDGRPFVAVKIG